MTYNLYFLHDNMAPKGILEDKIGKCMDYAILIIALSKAQGIPARFVSTFYTLPQELPHAWVEAYVDGDWISIPSTGYMDYDNSGIIELSDLKAQKNDNMLDTFINPFYYPKTHFRTDITFGYNNTVVEQMIAEVSALSGLSKEAKENLDAAKDLSLSWDQEESAQERHRIGRQSLELLLRVKAIFEEDVKAQEVQIAFLEDFPLPLARPLSRHVDQVADSESIIENLTNESTKVLYIFDDVVGLPNVSIEYRGEPPFINFEVVKLIRDFAKDQGFDIKLVFATKTVPPTLEFWNDEEVETVLDFKAIFDAWKTKDFGKNFLNAIDSVGNNIVDRTTFYLPEKLEGNDYHIKVTGKLEYEGKELLGYSIYPFKQIITNEIRGLLLKREVVMLNEEREEYTNLIIVNELGEIFKPEKKNGKYYYSKCPAGFIDFAAGQNLLIERDGDFVKITETGGE